MQQLTQAQQILQQLGQVKATEEKNASLNKIVSLCDEAISGLEGNPNKHMPYYFKGFALVQLGNYELANNSFDQGLAIKPDFFQFYGPKGQALQQLGKYDDAIEMYEKLVGLNKADTNIYNNKAIAHQKKGQLVQALQCFEKAGETYLVILNKASVLDDLGNYDEALENYDKALKFPEGQKDIRIFKNKARIQSLQKQTDDAKISCQQGLKIDPKNEELQQILGQIYILENKLDDADEIFDKILTSYPNNTKVLLFKGEIFLKKKEYAKAIQLFTKYQELISDDHLGYLRLGETYFEQTNYSEALNQFNKALEKNLTNDPICYFNQGNALKQLGQLENALKAYEQALSIKKDYIEALNNKGSILQNQGKYRDAIKCYDEILIVKDMIHAHNNKGNALRKLNEFNQAEEEFNKSIKLNDKYILAWTNRALLFNDQKKKKETISDLQVVKKLLEDKKNYEDLSDQNIDYIRKSVEMIIKTENQFEEQKKKLNEVMKNLDPNNKQVIQASKEIEQLEKQKDDHSGKLLEGMSNTHQQQNDVENPMEEMMTKFNELMKKFNSLKTQNVQLEEEIKQQDSQIMKIDEQTKNLNQIIVASGIYEKAKIKQGFEKYLKNKEIECYDYAKAFYWTLMNYFNSYMIANTGAFKKNLESATDEKTSLAVSVASTVLNLAGKVPIFGGICSILESAISGIYEQYKKKSFEEKMLAINKILQTSEEALNQEEWSMVIALSAQEIADRKKEHLRNQQLKISQVPDPNSLSTKTKIMNFINSKIALIKEKCFGPEVELFQSESSKEALSDVMIVLALMYKDQEMFISSSQKPLYIVISDVVASDDILKKLVTDDKQDQKENKQGDKTGNTSMLNSGAKTINSQSSSNSSCCQIM